MSDGYNRRGGQSGGSGGVGSGLLAASSDATGAADKTAINAALTANKIVRGQPGATYYLNGPLIVPSRSVLDMTGCTINQVGSGFNLFQNSAMAATRAVADAGATATSTTLTSATAAFVSGDIGSAIGVTGAGPGGSTWYGTITAVTNATTVTVSIAAETTVTNAALSIFSTRDKDITIRGGSWFGNDPGNNGHSVGATPQNDLFNCLRRIDGLTIRDMTWKTTGSIQQGGRFTLSLGDVTAFTIDNIVFNGTCGDGVHVFGPASNGTITNVSGTTGDDMVAVNTEDSNTPNITDTSGNLSDIYIGQLRGVAAYDCVKYYAIGTAKKYTTSRLTIDGVHGTSAAYGVVVLSVDVVNGLEIRDVDVATSGSSPAVRMATTDSATDVTIRGVRWTSTAVASGGIIAAPGPRGAWKISDVTMVTAPAGTNYAVLVSGNMGNGTTFGCTLDIDGVYCVQGPSGTTPAATFHVLNLSSTSGTVGAITIRGVQSFPTTAGSIILANAATTLKNVELADISASGTNIVQLPASNPACIVRISNVSFSGTNVVNTGGPVVLKLVNADITTTGAVVAAVGAGATPVTGWYTNFTQAGAGANASKDGTQTVAVNVATYTNTAF